MPGIPLHYRPLGNAVIAPFHKPWTCEGTIIGVFNKVIPPGEELVHHVDWICKDCYIKVLERQHDMQAANARKDRNAVLYLKARVAWLERRLNRVGTSGEWAGYRSDPPSPRTYMLGAEP